MGQAYRPVIAPGAPPMARISDWTPDMGTEPGHVHDGWMIVDVRRSVWGDTVSAPSKVAEIRLLPGEPAEEARARYGWVRNETDMGKIPFTPAGAETLGELLRKDAASRGD
jgi:hypothetical protein